MHTLCLTSEKLETYTHCGKLHFTYAKDYNTGKPLHDLKEVITFFAFLEKASLSEAFVLVMLELECV